MVDSISNITGISPIPTKFSVSRPDDNSQQSDEPQNDIDDKAEISNAAKILSDQSYNSDTDKSADVAEFNPESSNPDNTTTSNVTSDGNFLVNIINGQQIFNATLIKNYQN